MPADPLHLAIPDGLDLTGALCRTTSLGKRVRVAYRAPMGGWVCVYVDGGGRAVITLPARCLRLDLSDDVSRMRVMQWIAMRVGGSSFGAHCHGIGRYFIVHGLGFDVRRTWASLGIDPNDPTLLPDGSWHVDALALAAVGRQYAELTGEAPC